MSRPFFVGTIAAAVCGLVLALYLTRDAPNGATLAPSREATRSPLPIVDRKVNVPAPRPMMEATAPAVVLPHEQAELSREEAQAWLKSLVIQMDSTDEPLPELDLRPEDSATPSERDQILRARQLAQEKGSLLIIARMPDGTLYYHQSAGEFPRTFFPEHVRKNLTEEDWEIFQVEIAVASLRRDLVRAFKRKASQKSAK